MKKILGWLLPVFLLSLGVALYLFPDGYRFLGVLLCVSAGIVCVYKLLTIWERRSRMPAKVIRTLLSILLALILAAFSVTVCFVLRGPETMAQQNCDYVLVLGAGVKGDTPSRILGDRIQRAYEYLLDHPNAICIASGGMGDDENLSEAQCIFNHLTAMGIAPERIWLEDRATSTVENFRFTLELIREKTGNEPVRLLVLSNEFHLYRASRMAADQGVEASFISAPTSSLGVRINYTVREVFALWKYLLIGG